MCIVLVRMGVDDLPAATLITAKAGAISFWANIVMGVMLL